MVSAAELKQEWSFRVEGEIYKVLEVESKAGAAKSGGVVKAKVSNVKSHRTWEPHFRPQERLEEIELARVILHVEPEGQDAGDRNGSHAVSR